MAQRDALAPQSGTLLTGQIPIARLDLAEPHPCAMAPRLLIPFVVVAPADGPRRAS